MPVPILHQRPSLLGARKLSGQECPTSQPQHMPSLRPVAPGGAAVRAQSVQVTKGRGTSVLKATAQELLVDRLRDQVANTPVAMEDIAVRDVKGISYVSRRRMDTVGFDPNAVDEDGLPLVYNEKAISDYWSDRPGELFSRWTRFTAISAPWLTRLANAVLSGKLAERQVPLAADAVENLQKLGPTFIKLGQIMSIRPDVMPPPVMKELARLQDNITPFSCEEAKAVVAKELGMPLDSVFSEWSEKPVGAASLAQVYKARLRSNGEYVAVKVQRPGALATISKDLYVLRRAVGTYEQLVKRFTAQTTDYQQLVSTFAEGLYTEMDFQNEALNAMRMVDLLDSSEFASSELVIPRPYMEFTTRRGLTMEWVAGVKLTTLPPAEIRALVKVGQEAFLTQLLEIGLIHGDPHPGNLLKVVEGPNAGKLCLLDFGLVAEIPAPDREAMVSATIHLANRDWDALTNDFISLGFLPNNCDRGVIIPVMDRVLSPYLRGGGARAFNFQALSQDLLATTLEIPFAVPPYMSLLARSIATLEGIALAGDPEYQMVAQAYPFVVRKVLRNDSVGSSALLRDILYDSATGNVKATRLSALLQAGLGYVADVKVSGGVIDLDAVPQEGASVSEVVTFLLSPEARELRPLLVDQLATGLDLAIRDRVRRLYALLPTLAPRLPFFGALLPPPPPPPVFVPSLGFVSAEQALELLAPGLNRGEEVYLASLQELAAGLLGVPAKELENPSIQQTVQLLSSPSEQVRELRDALVAIGGRADNQSAAQAMALEVAEELAKRQSQRANIPVDTLFGPALNLARQVVSSLQLQSSTTARKPVQKAPTPSNRSGSLEGTSSSSIETPLSHSVGLGEGERESLLESEAKSKAVAEVVLA